MIQILERIALRQYALLCMLQILSYRCTISLVIDMERPSRRPNRIEDYDYSQSGAYFITICTQARKRILSDIVGTPVPGCPQNETVKLLPLGEIAEKVICQIDAFYGDLSVDKYVIMPDHIHMLITIHGHPGRGVPTEKEERTSRIARLLALLNDSAIKSMGQTFGRAVITTM